MPLHWTISHPSKLVLAVAKGIVQPPEVHHYFEAITAGGARPYRKMFNLTHMESVFDADTLRGFASAVRANAANNPVGPIALVARSPIGQQQAEIFAKAATIDRPLKIFVEEHEARRWLDEVAPAGGRKNAGAAGR
jgi:hypothetical protein